MVGLRKIKTYAKNNRGDNKLYLVCDMFRLFRRIKDVRLVYLDKKNQDIQNTCSCIFTIIIITIRESLYLI